MTRLMPACAAILVLCSAGGLHAQSSDVTIMPDDLVMVTVEGHPDLGGQYAVELDGSVLFPLVGRVEVGGLTVHALTGVLAGRLQAYISAPRVRVEFRPPERVFVFGDVQRPGLYDLPKGMTVLELLLQAQYSGVSEVLVVRTGNVRAPVLPYQAQPSDVIRVNLRQLESDVERGDLSRNLPLETGDTVFVPTLDPNTAFVSGEVNRPGPYSVPDGATVLQMLTLAGWLTEQGSPERVRVVHFEGTERTESRAELDTVVHPGDTIVVQEPFFNPSFGFDQRQINVGGVRAAVGGVGAPALSGGEIRLGRNLVITPALVFDGVGVDSNVFFARDDEDRKSDFVMSMSSQVGIGLDLRRVRLRGNLAVGMRYYQKFKSQRSVDPGYGVSVEYDLARRVALAAGYGFNSTRDRFTYDLDARVRRNERATTAGVTFGPWGRVSFELAGSISERLVPDVVIFGGQDLRVTLDQRIQTATLSVGLRLTPVTSLDLSYTPSTFRFPRFPARNADASEFRVGTSFAPSALVQGSVYVGYLHYFALDDSVEDYVGPIMGGSVGYTWRERTQVGVRGDRTTDSSYQGGVAFVLVDRAGGWIGQSLSNMFDVVLELDREQYNYRGFDVPGPLGQLDQTTLTGTRVGMQFGVRLGGSRVAINTVYEPRYDAWIVGIQFQYGIFQVSRQ